MKPEDFKKMIEVGYQLKRTFHEMVRGSGQIVKEEAFRWLRETANSDLPLHERLKYWNGLRSVLFSYNRFQIPLSYTDGLGFFEAMKPDQPKDVVFSFIFINFLVLGGIEYYGFCLRCEDFFIAERKGRKKFCSNLCRAYHAKEKDWVKEN